MAGTVTVTYVETRTVKRVALAWVSDASGVVSGTLTKTLSGEIARVSFVPDGGGTQPSDLYDLTLLDADGTDVLSAAGANLSNASKTNSVVPGRLVDSTLELSITNAGNAKGGTLVLWMR